MAALLESSALGQFLPYPARRPIKFLGGRNVTHVIQVANMGKNVDVRARVDVRPLLLSFSALAPRAYEETAKGVPVTRV
jgi:hypothetical protein